MVSIGDINQLRHDAHLAGSVADASFQHVANTELPANLADVHVLVFERKGGGACDHEKAVNVRERVDDLLGDAVAEILLILRLAKIEKRQDRDTFSGNLAIGDGFAERECWKTSTPITASSTPMMTKSSLRPVLRAIDFSGAISSVRCSPSGVSSYAQASTSATGNPNVRTTTTNRAPQFGISKIGKTCVAIWMSNQLTTP